MTMRPEADTIPLLERVRLYTLYALPLIAIPAVVVNLAFMGQDADLLALVCLGGFGALVIGAVLLFWLSRRIRWAQYLVAAGTLMLMADIVAGAGGPVGFGVLYFIAGFPILYLLFGYRTGILLTLFLVAGFALRLAAGNYHPQSLYHDPAMIARMLAILAIAAALSVFASSCMHSFVKHLSRLATREPITGLPNRLKLQEFLANSVREAERDGGAFSLIGVKLINYNRVNATLGTERGDQMLREITARLSGSLAGSTIIGRWSGSLFLCLLPTDDLERILAQSSESRQILSEPILAGHNKIYLQFVIGVSRYPADARDGESLLQNVISIVDRNLQTQNEILFFNEASLRKEQRRFALIEAMNHASLDGEFSLVYQPKIDLASSRCHGAEVLLRWNNPRHGTIEPGEFIKLAEETGFIRKLSHWVIARAFADLSGDTARGVLQGKGLIHAINLSVSDLKDHDLMPFLTRMLLEHRCSPPDFEFEVTESMLVDDDPQIQQSLQDLATLGFRIAIDDFGTGYSSLSYLHRLKVQNLKVDRSFVSLIIHDKQDINYPVVDAIISMGLALGLQITAEGVESEAQAAYLRRRYCHNAQGWLYAKGLPLAEYLEFLALSCPAAAGQAGVQA